jgi:hypothetical protein
MAVISYREALNQAMREEMERDPDVFIMGEEVGHYNGAYKVTRACCSGSASAASSTRRSPRWGSPGSVSARRWSGCARSSSS